MSITTYTSRAIEEEITEHEINCPKCNKKMYVFDQYKARKHKKGEHFLSVAVCKNGCLNEHYEPGDIKEHFFCAWDFKDLVAVHKRLVEKEKNKH